MSCAPALVALALLLAACDGSPPAVGSTEETQDRLHGSWARDHADQGVRSRRILTLRPDGAFRETVRVTDQAGAVSEFVHEGAWFYDGTNLKRKYTLMNGQPPSRLNVPFVTFEIRFESRNDFTGVDHIHRNKVHYRRVPAQADF